MTRLQSALFAALLALFPNIAPSGDVALAHDARPSEAELPADLRLLPDDTVLFCRLRMNALWDTDAARQWQADQKDRPGSWGRFEATFKKQYGVSPEAVTAITMACGSARDEDIFALVTTDKPYDRAAVLKAVLPDAQEGQHSKKPLWTSASRPDRALHFISDTTFVVAPSVNVKNYLDARVGGAEKGPLGHALRLTSEPHPLVVGIREDGIRGAAPKDPAAEPAKGVARLLHPRGATVPDVVTVTTVVDYAGSEATGRTIVAFADEATATKSVGAVKERVRFLRLVPLALAFSQGKDDDLTPAVKLLDRTTKALDTPAVVQKGKTVEVVISVDIGADDQIHALRVLSGMFAR